jgi:hypothetical protein
MGAGPLKNSAPMAKTTTFMRSESLSVECHFVQAVIISIASFSNPIYIRLMQAQQAETFCKSTTSKTMILQIVALGLQENEGTLA